MSLKRLINTIANLEEVKAQPPVLIDIGASKEIHPYWKAIAHFSICLAFDADDRDFELTEDENSAYKKLIKVNKIVVAALEDGQTRAPFYLTQSPYCSSLLEPDEQPMSALHFSDLFKLVEKTEFEVVAFSDVLEKVGLTYVDWFKTDSQGTDVRLFQSLPDAIQDNMLCIEFEPGFIHAYKGEDLIPECLTMMETKPQYFLNEFVVKGPLRIPSKDFKSIFKGDFGQRLATHVGKQIPGWAEMSYLNSLETKKPTLRDSALAWLFATIRKQHDIAFVYADRALMHGYDAALFSELKSHSSKKLKSSVWSLSSFLFVVHNKIQRILD